MLWWWLIRGERRRVRRCGEDQSRSILEVNQLRQKIGSMHRS